MKNPKDRKRRSGKMIEVHEEHVARYLESLSLGWMADAVFKAECRARRLDAAVCLRDGASPALWIALSPLAGQPAGRA
jgi:hypothetical protein